MNRQTDKVTNPFLFRHGIMSWCAVIVGTETGRYQTVYTKIGIRNGQKIYWFALEVPSAGTESNS